MSEITQLLAACDESFGHMWDSVLSALKGTSADEAGYQHHAYRLTGVEQNMPPAGTILWQMAHLSVNKQNYARILQENLGVKVPEVIEPRKHTAAILLHDLRIAHSRLHAVLAALSDADLARELPRESGYPMRVDAFIRMITRHDAWHGGQIAVARRLYRTRNA